MKILINDILQSSDAPEALISPSLSDTYTVDGELEVNIPVGTGADCIGVGNTDASYITVNGEMIELDRTDLNGLYFLPAGTIPDYDIILGDVETDMYLGDVSTDMVLGDVQQTVTISISGTYIGRLALGTSRSIYASPSREPGFYTTSEPRVTAAGQVIAGAGGYSGRRIDLDFRYKIDRDIFQDIQDSYASQISKGFPFFLYFDKETGRMPWTRLYASTDNNLLFQSSVNRFLYSRKFAFTERF
jgi:hypothetical protein